MSIRQRQGKLNSKALKVFCILLIVLGLFKQEAFSGSDKDTSSSDDAVTVRLKIGVITEVEFPVGIANVTKSISAELLQVDTLGNRMFLLPLEGFDTYIHVITADNISYCLHLIIDGSQNNTLIKIKKRSSAAGGAQDREAINTIELMKALLRNEPPEASAALKLYNQEVFNNGKLRILLDKVYELRGGAKALVLTFENLMDKPIVLPIENIELSGLLAISVDSQILEARPRNKNRKDLSYATKAYLIVKAQSQ